MSTKSLLKSLKSSSSGDPKKLQGFSKISLRLSDFENLNYLGDEAEIEISGTLNGNRVEKATLRHLDENAALNLSFEINCQDAEEVLSLFSNPVQCK